MKKYKRHNTNIKKNIKNRWKYRAYKEIMEIIIAEKMHTIRNTETQK